MNMNLYLGMNRALKHTIYGIRSALMCPRIPLQHVGYNMLEVARCLLPIIDNPPSLPPSISAKSRPRRSLSRASPNAHVWSSRVGQGLTTEQSR